ncbi:MAG: threonine synthase [Deltaproteobacteria bacterium]|nr:threonine synthase [Deltaproteobacteria bacterium]
MSFLGTTCARCSEDFAPHEASSTCPACHANLDVRVELPADARAQIEASADRSMWRYAPLLPVDAPSPEDGTLTTVGGTPLFMAPALAKRLGLGQVWIKDEGREPTGSLKDRASAVVVQRARALGESRIITASTGNAGVALAAMAQAAGLEAIILVPESAPAAKLAQLQIFGARLFLVRGSYDDAFDLATEASAELGIYCRNTGTNPFTVEGKKTVSFELAEQLGWRVPDAIVVSVGDGNILTGVHKGLKDLLGAGLIARMPRLYGVQARGSSPIAQAFFAGSDEVPEVEAATVADSISAGRPSDGWRALRAARETGGAFVVVEDEAILRSIAELGRDAAVFAEPAAAAAHAGLVKLAAEGTLTQGDEVALLITGTGLKDVGAAARAAGASPPTIEKSLDALSSALTERS